MAVAVEPPTDAMLDVYNDLARAVRGEEGETLSDLNERLRSVFEEFGLDRVAEGTTGVMPVLRPDALDRLASDPTPVVVGPDKITPGDGLPDRVPVALLLDSCSRPPARSFEVLRNAT